MQADLDIKALIESEERYRTLVEASSLIVWTADAEGRTYRLPGWFELTGQTEEEAKGDGWLDVIHPDDGERVEETIRREHERGFELEYRVIRKDGSVRWVWDRAFPIKDEKGQVYRVAGIAEDITERKEAEDNLRKSADEIRDLYNSAPCGYHSLDENGVYIQINDTELCWLGLTRADVIGKLRFIDVLTAESQEKMREKYPHFLEAGSVHDEEYQVVCKGGITKYVLLSAKIARDDNGKFIKSRATLYDITERKQAAEKFAKAFQSSPVGLSITRLSDGKYLEVNETLEKAIGYSREELIGRSTLELGLWQNPADRPRVAQQLGTYGSLRDWELRFLTREGKEIIAQYSAELIEMGGEKCSVNALSDITERRYIESALRANEALLKQFVKHTPAAIAMFDTEMRYLQVSDRFLTDYQLQGQDIIGKRHYDVFPDIPERWKAVHRRILAGAIERCDEDPYIAPDGSQGWLQWESLPWHKAGGEIGGLILFTQVITERKRAETALKNSEEQLRALSARMQSTREEEGTRIAREIHDELGSALSGLKWDLEAIDSRLVAANGDPLILDVRKRIGAMTGLIESTIDSVRRISSELRPGVLDDLGLVAAIEWQGQQFQTRTGINVHWKTTMDTVQISREAATAVFRIFQEVLTNVLRHSRARNVYLKLSRRRRQIELEVRDDGRGITERERRNTRSLGLLGMKERALLVGGEVEISGAKGKGTKVVIRVPLSLL